MTENEAFIYESIVFQIKAGFSSVDEIESAILEEIEDNGFEEEITEQWAFVTINREWDKLIAESSQWPRPTATERLIEAFDKLCAANIIALHNAGYTTSDGEAEVVEVETELLANDTQSDGYCFYHSQDLQRAMDNKNPSLYLAFQRVDNTNDAVTVAVGAKVVQIIKESGLDVAWNQTANSKILLPNFRWQLAYSENNQDLLDYARVVRKMMKIE